MTWNKLEKNSSKCQFARQIFVQIFTGWMDEGIQLRSIGKGFFSWISANDVQVDHLLKMEIFSRSSRSTFFSPSLSLLIKRIGLVEREERARISSWYMAISGALEKQTSASFLHVQYLRSFLVLVIFSSRKAATTTMMRTSQSCSMRCC